MTILTITSRGQVTFRKEVLQHLGIQPGEKIELDLLPGGRGLIKAPQPAHGLEGFVGLLAGKSSKRATLAEISESTSHAWADKS